MKKFFIAFLMLTVCFCANAQERYGRYGFCDCPKTDSSDFRMAKEVQKKLCIIQTNGLVSSGQHFSFEAKTLSEKGRFIRMEMVKVETKPESRGAGETPTLVDTTATGYEVFRDYYVYSQESAENMDVLVISEGVYFISDTKKEVRLQGIVFSQREFDMLNRQNMLEKTLFKFYFPDPE